MKEFFTQELIEKNNGTEAKEELNPQSGVVADEELEGIAGGISVEDDAVSICMHWTCVVCGQFGNMHTGIYNSSDGGRWRCPDNASVEMHCNCCKYNKFVGDKGSRVCTYSSNHA